VSENETEIEKLSEALKKEDRRKGKEIPRCGVVW